MEALDGDPLVAGEERGLPVRRGALESGQIDAGAELEHEIVQRRLDGAASAGVQVLGGIGLASSPATAHHTLPATLLAASRRALTPPFPAPAQQQLIPKPALDEA